ncbi:MAG: ATP-binding protein [Chloroflexota bacterium]|nr:ATP-binding protein [Chloroflexota bacterium]
MSGRSGLNARHRPRGHDATRWPSASFRRILTDGSSIRVRLTLWYVALLAVILVLFSGFVYVSLERRIRDETDRLLELQARRLQPPPEAREFPPRPPRPIRTASASGGTVVGIFDETGRDFFAGESWDGFAALGEARSLAAAGQRDLRTVVLADGEPWRVLTVPIVVDGDVQAVGQIARSEVPGRSALDELLLLFATAVPLTLALAVAIGLFLAGRALDPIDRITRMAARINADDLSRRLGLPPRDDEVGRLAATFDTMLDRLDRAFRRQRQFTADASHELRTPLAMLRGQIELALDRPRSAEEYEATLVSLGDDVRRMEGLLGDLLTLARADAGRLPLVPEPLDLADLATDVAAAMEPLASARGVRLTRSGGGALPIVADQTRLTQLLVNLLDNAVKYTPDGGTVTVSTGRDAGQAILSVADTGIGVAPEHLPHLFERFYRADAARARAEGGAGLGLSISRWIAEAHGGRIDIESRLGEGTTVTVRLPVLDDVGRPARRADFVTAARTGRPATSGHALVE